MSIELVASWHRTPQLGSLVAEHFRQSPAYEVLREEGDDTLHVRFTKHPRREQWPEDFSVQLQSSSLAVTFHSATRPERNETLRALEQLLSQNGCDVSFEEP